MDRKHLRGFTLIELLVVIAIIGILMSVSLAAYGQYQKKTRDSRRINDLKAMQNAWEQYYSDNNSNYPGDTSTPIPCLTPAPEDVMKKYMPGGYPKDPRTGDAYSPLNCSPNSYCFCATLESSTYATSDCNDVVTTNMHCVKNLQ